MEIRSILVNIDIAAPDSPALRYAIDLASKVGASLIGVAADQPNIAYAGIDGGAAVVDVYSLEISEIETQLRRAEEAFQARVPQRTRACFTTGRPASAMPDPRRCLTGFGHLPSAASSLTAPYTPPPAHGPPSSHLRARPHRHSAHA